MDPRLAKAIDTASKSSPADGFVSAGDVLNAGAGLDPLSIETGLQAAAIDGEVVRLAANSGFLWRLTDHGRESLPKRGRPRKTAGRS